MRRAIAYILIALACASCVSFPPVRDDTGLLVVKKDADRTTRDSYYVYYRLYYTQDEYIKLFPNGSIQFIDKLEPGEYTCFRLESVYINSGKRGKIYPMYCRFVIEEGKYTIFPSIVKSYMKKGDDGIVYQYHDFIQLDEAGMKGIQDELSEVDGYEGWVRSEI